MEFLPTTLGTRPRLAVEVRPEGIVAARAEDAAALLSAVARANIPEGAVAPGLKAGNIADHPAVVSAVRKVLDEVAGKAPDRSIGRDVTVVVPDAAVRVLLLDFDQLPSKTAEALPVVRFRLKKLLPFDVDTATVSHQVMSSERGIVRVLAVAIPKDVLGEYESVVTAAGYLPGAVLPSTLAALAGLDTVDSPVLVVNAGTANVTTAIVRSGNLLLHRSLDLTASAADIATTMSVTLAGQGQPIAPSRDIQSQQRLGGYDRVDAEAAMQTSIVTQAEIREMTATANTQAIAREVTQAVSVAAAYFEDTLQASPEILLTAGTMSADKLLAMIETNGFGGLRVEEMIDAGKIEASAVSAAVSRGWLAGVRGALKS